MNRALAIRVGLLLLPWILLVGPLLAQVRDSGVTSRKEKDKPAAGRKDPAEDALALPRGVVLENLRKDQQEAYNKLKEEYRPKLQKALDQVANAPNAQDKTKAAREVNKLRGEIKPKIAEILTQPDPELVKRMQQAAKRYNTPKPPQKNHKRK